MIPAANILAFSLAALALIVIPGPSVLFVIGRSLSLGRVGGLLSVVGNSAGVFAATVAVAFGVGALLESSAIVFTTVKVLGAAYLIFLGLQAIRHRNRDAAGGTAPQPRRSPLRILGEGFIVGLTNVKTIIFMVAVLPLFVSNSAGNLPGQILTLGAVFIAIALVSDGIWALAAGAARDWFARSPKRIATLGASGGVMMIGLGTAVLFLDHKAA